MDRSSGWDRSRLRVAAFALALLLAVAGAFTTAAVAQDDEVLEENETDDALFQENETQEGELFEEGAAEDGEVQVPDVNLVNFTFANETGLLSVVVDVPLVAGGVAVGAIEQPGEVVTEERDELLEGEEEPQEEIFPENETGELFHENETGEIFPENETGEVIPEPANVVQVLEPFAGLENATLAGAEVIDLGVDEAGVPTLRVQLDFEGVVAADLAEAPGFFGDEFAVEQPGEVVTEDEDALFEEEQNGELFPENETGEELTVDVDGEAATDEV